MRGGNCASRDAAMERAAIERRPEVDQPAHGCRVACGWQNGLAAAVATLAAHIHAATYRLLVLIAELDRRGVWADQGALTCAHRLGWACGIDAHTAREKVRVARALEGPPLLSAAAARGEFSYSKLRALTRIATVENEADLVDIGLHGTAQHVEKFVHLYRQAERAEETEHADAQHKDRGLTYWYEDDSTLVLQGRFPPETGARILSALDAAMEAHAAEQPASEWNSEGKASDVPNGTSRGEATGPAQTPKHFAGAGVPRRERRSPPTSQVRRIRADPPTPCAGPTPWRGWPSGCSRRARLRHSAPTATRWWCTSMSRCSPGARRVGVTSRTTPPSRRGPRGGSAATQESSPLWTDRGESR